MKGFIENTIPQRQFENIKVRIYFENEDERQEAIDNIIQSSLDLHHVVKEMALEKRTEELKEEAKKPCDHMKMINGKPHRFSRSQQKWIEVKAKGHYNGENEVAGLPPEVADKLFGGDAPDEIY